LLCCRVGCPRLSLTHPAPGTRPEPYSHIKTSRYRERESRSGGAGSYLRVIVDCACRDPILPLHFHFSSSLSSILAWKCSRLSVGASSLYLPSSLHILLSLSEAFPARHDPLTISTSSCIRIAHSHFTFASHCASLNLYSLLFICCCFRTL
jgi:hypothetical protein